MRTDGELIPVNAEMGDAGGTNARAQQAHLPVARHPADRPGRAGTYFQAKTPKAAEMRGQRGHDQAAFEQIGSAITQVVPTRTAAGLHQAAARIPGVERRPRPTMRSAAAASASPAGTPLPAHAL